MVNPSVTHMMNLRHRRGGAAALIQRRATTVDLHAPTLFFLFSNAAPASCHPNLVNSKNTYHHTSHLS